MMKKSNFEKYTFFKIVFFKIWNLQLFQFSFLKRNTCFKNVEQHFSPENLGYQLITPVIIPAQPAATA